MGQFENLLKQTEDSDDELRKVSDYQCTITDQSNERAWESRRVTIPIGKMGKEGTTRECGNEGAENV